MSFRSVFALFLLASLQLFSDIKDSDVIAATEGDPTLNVADHVNLLTGDLVISQIDYVVPGVIPLPISRFYVSGDGIAKHGGWEFVPHYILELMPEWLESKKGDLRGRRYTAMKVKEPNGSAVYYKRNNKPPQKERPKKWWNSFSINFDENGKGITNYARGEISGRTNLRNSRVVVDKDKKIAYVHCADGTIREYKRSHTRTKDCVMEFFLLWERLPDGNMIWYEPGTKGRPGGVRTTDPTAKKTYNSYKIHYDSISAARPDFYIETSDGKRLDYRFKRRREKKKPGYIDVLESVSSPVLPTETTYYNDYIRENNYSPLLRGPVVHTRALPDGRFINFEYYNYGEEDIKSTDDPRCDRVKAVLAPVAPDGSITRTHRIYYQINRKKLSKKTYGKNAFTYSELGVTEVYDVYNNKTVLRFSPSFYPLSYEDYNDRGELQRTTSMQWGDYGQIQKKSLLDPQQGEIWSYSYVYDAKGNVLEEKLHGNLTGNSSSEVSVKRSSYYENNLLKECIEDNGKITRLTYFESTNLPTSKIITDDKELCIREFFSYSSDRILVRHVIDDGRGAQESDLTGVTERKIQVIQLYQEGPHFNLPETIEERVWDGSQERLLSKTVLFYSRECQLIRKDLYDANGAFCYSLHMRYDSMGRLAEETNPIGQVAKSIYDSHGNKISQEDFSGTLRSKMTYDASNRLIQREDLSAKGELQISTHAYNLKNQKIQTIDRFGNSTQFRYDAFGRLIETKLPTVLDERGEKITPTILVTYDAAGRETSRTNPQGETTYTQYNARGKPLLIRHPDGTEERFFYNLSGTLQRAIDQTGTRTSYTYDILDRILSKSIHSPSGDLLSEETFTYNAFHLLSQTDAEGNTYFYSYDSAGRKIAEECQNERTEYCYDALGRLQTQHTYGTTEDLLTHTEYDLLNRPVEERLEDSLGTLFSRTLYQYDSAGNKSCITRWVDGRASRELFFYDSFARPIKQVDALGHCTYIRYDDQQQNALGQKVLLKTRIDPLGVQFLETHDALGRVVRSEQISAFGDPLALEEFYYTATGKLARQVSTIFSPNASPQISSTAWEYGCMDRLITLVEAEGSEEQKVTRFTYTAKGLLHTTQKPDGTLLTNSYDPLSRQIALTASDGSCAYAYQYNRLHQLIQSRDLNSGATTLRSYDPKGRLLEERLANGLTLSNDYDPLGHRIKLTLPDNSTILYTYDAFFLRAVTRGAHTHRYTHYDHAGHLLQEKLIGNLGSSTYTIDPLGRLLSISSPIGSQNVDAYDPAGNILQMSYSDQESVQYTYDPLGQLTQETGPFAHTFSYDSHYNRKSKDNASYQTNALCQLLATDTTHYTYDPNGNPLSKKSASSTTHYTYDALDRLIEVTEPGKFRCTFSYDSWHRRLTKSCFLWNEGYWQKEETLFFLYDNNNEIGATDSSGQILQLRILGATPQAEISAAVALELQGQTYVPLHNITGSVCALLSLSGQIVETYTYSAFGEEPPAQYINPWRFSSKRTDPETGLVYYGRRFYDPSIGRWLTPDPQGLSDGPNLYAFVHNAPLTHFDLYGLEDLQSRPILDFFRPGLTAAKSTIDFIGHSVNFLFYHFMPIPGIREFGMAVGNAISWNNPRARQESSSFYTEGAGHLSDKQRTLSVNGILNHLEDAKASAKSVSDSLQGTSVHGVHNSSHGFILDVLECGVGMLGFQTRSSRLLAESIRARIGEMGGTDGGGTIDLFAHSQGGILTKNALKLLTPEERRMVKAHTFGSAEMNLGSGISQQHYASRFDVVPMLASPVQSLKTLFGVNRNINFIKGSTPFADHAFNSNVYKSVMQEVSDKIVRRYRGP